MKKSQLVGSILKLSVTSLVLSAAIISNAHAAAMGAASSYVDWSTMSISTSSSMSVSMNYVSSFVSTEAYNDLGETNGPNELASSGVSNVSSGGSVLGSRASSTANAINMSAMSSANGTGSMGYASSTSRSLYT